MNLIYKQNGTITSKEIIDLCSAVGWSRKIDDYEIILNNYFAYYVCYDDKKVVGFVSVISDGFLNAYIQDLMVHPNYQCNEIGSNLLKMSINYIKKNRIQNVSLICYEKLIEFYKKHNFKIQASGRLKLN